MGNQRKQRAMISEWSSTGDFFGSIVAGLVLGLLADQIFGTAPWFVVIGIIAGFGVGFWRMVAYSKAIIDEVERQRGSDYLDGSGGVDKSK